MDKDDAARRVLVVDDEESLAALVAGYLERAGYEVTLAYDGQVAVDLARQVDPDVVVLDLGLPTLDGVEVCRVLRTFSDCCVIMVTARADEVDKLVGLRVGADDYVTKPFSPRELVARVDVMLRHPRRSVGAPVPPGADEAPPRTFGDLEIDVADRDVRLGDVPVDLTRTELDVLEALSARPRLAFSRRQLIEAVWGDNWVGDDRVAAADIARAAVAAATDSYAARGPADPGCRGRTWPGTRRRGSTGSGPGESAGELPAPHSAWWDGGCDRGGRVRRTGRASRPGRRRRDRR